MIRWGAYTTMSKLILKTGTVANFDKVSSKLAGCLYLATDGSDKAYFYYDNGTTKLNIVPRKLEIANGGTGMTTNPSMLIDLASDKATNVFAAAPRPGVTGTLPVKHGGTGKTAFDNRGILYGNGTGAIAETAKGAQGQVLSANASGVPGFYTPTLDWSGNVLTLGIAGKSYTAAIPAAAASTIGLVNTESQTYTGRKTFQDTVTVSSGLNISGASVTYASNTVTIAFDS